MASDPTGAMSGGDLAPDLLAELSRLTHEYAALYRDAVQQAAWSRTDLEDLRRTLAVVAHDLRSPLTVMTGATELLLDDAALAPRHRDLVQRIENAAQVMTAMAQDLVDSMGLKHSGLILAPVDVVQMVETVVARQRIVRTHRERIDVHVDVPEDTAVVVMGDRARLERAVDNLVSNALKYSPPEEVVFISVLVAPEGDGHGPSVSVQVSDRGAGVPEEHQEAIFTAFTRAPNTAATPGTGLGLAIVKEIAELHRGSVRLVSTEGVGSTFTLELPLLPATAEPVEGEPAVPPARDRSASVA